MSYQLADGVTTVSFVRPAHRLMVLHGERILPCRVLGLTADRLTEGHRFQGARRHRDRVRRTAMPSSCSTRGRVVSAFEARRERIDDRAARPQQRARRGARRRPAADESAVAALLDEVTALVEWPAVYVGRFEEHFLEVPAGMPDPDDAHQPEVLPALRRARAGCCRAS